MVKYTLEQRMKRKLEIETRLKLLEDNYVYFRHYRQHDIELLERTKLQYDEERLCYQEVTGEEYKSKIK